MNATTYELEIGQLGATPWLPSPAGRGLPHLPQLRPLRFTAEEQQAAPDQPRTRLVKDVLRTGRWKAGQNPDGSPRWWTVTAATLDQIAHSFAAAVAAGNAFNLCWGHGARETGLVDSRDAIAPLDQLFHEGDTLWASAYVDAATAAELRKAVRKVSVRVADRWMDGAGNIFPMALLHVAVVDLPVLTGQGPFLDLAHPLTPNEGQTDMDFETQLDLWTRAFTALGLTMPDPVTAETLPVVVDALLASVEESPDEEDDPTPAAASETLPALTPAAGANLPADLAAVLTGFVGQLKDLSHQVALLKTDGARAAFNGKLETLAQAGRINARTVASLTQTGAGHGWDLSLLTPFEDLQMVDMSRRGKPLATGAPPSATGLREDLSDDDIQQGVALLKTGKIAGKIRPH